MPPALLLKNDKFFYGKLKPTGFTGANPLEHPAPPPNPMSNVSLTNPIQRQNAIERIEKDLSTPNDLKSSENPVIQAELGGKDIEKLKNSDDIGSRFVKFLQTPLIETSKEQQAQQQKREVQRIGLSNDNLEENQVRPVGELPLKVAEQGGELIERGFAFLENKAMNIILLIGGIYIASQFAGAVGSNIGKPKKSE